ncbi:TPA: hypothetical protein ENS27_10520 [bacterium]|nr:hypothetical protein [bacterium]
MEVIYKFKSYNDGSVLDFIPSRLELSYSLKSPGQKEQLLSKLVSKIEKNYDAIIFDCPPTESLITTAAYLASEYILVPVKPEYLSTIGLPLLARSMDDFRRQYEDHNLELAGIIFNDTSSSYNYEKEKSKEEVRKIASSNGWYVFENEIGYSSSYPKGSREDKAIFHTSYAHQKQSSKFKAFYYELKQRIGL